MKYIKYVCVKTCFLLIAFFIIGCANNSIDNLNNLFIDTVKKGDLLLVKELVNNGANINSLDKTRSNYAFLVGNKYSLDESVTLNALGIASEKGFLSIVKYLIKNNIDKTSYSAALIASSSKGHFEIVKYLYLKGEKYIAKKAKLRAFKESVLLSNIDIADYILSKGLNGNRENKNFIFPQPYQKKIPSEVVRYYISKGVSFNQSTFIYAIQSGDLETVKFLIDKGAKLNWQTPGQDSALILAIKENQLNLVKYLIKKGVNVNSLTWHGESVLMIAARMGNIKVVKLLVNSGANINYVGRFMHYGEIIDKKITAMKYAKLGNHADVIQYLRSLGAK
jgi:ankyrin repeat protein